MQSYTTASLYQHVFLLVISFLLGTRAVLGHRLAYLHYGRGIARLEFPRVLYPDISIGEQR